MLIEILTTILVILVLYLAFWKFWFLRDPERTAPKGNNIVCPADGTVIKIMKFDITKSAGKDKKVKKDKMLIEKGKNGSHGQIMTYVHDVAKKGWIVSIFMSPFNVHVNRAPISGEIISQKHTKGKFYPTNNFIQSFTLNEKNEVIFKKGNFKVKAIQVAGTLARRIVWFIKKGNKIKKGDRYGLINLGSQVTTIMPENVKIVVKEGDKVKAGETILAEIKGKR